VLAAAELLFVAAAIAMHVLTKCLLYLRFLRQPTPSFSGEAPRTFEAVTDGRSGHVEM